jgi:hypothetical protein
MLPGFGYRFLRQRRQHRGPTTDRGITVIGHAALVFSDGVRTVREEFRYIADGRFENSAPISAAGTKSAAIEQEMPEIDLRRSHQDAVLASQFLSAFPGFDQGKRTFA